MQKLKQKIASRKATIGVLGLGYMGLTLLDAFRKAGFPLVGYDRNQSKIRSFQQGESYVTHVDMQALFLWAKKKKCKVSTDPSILKEADVLIISTSTPLDSHQVPDLSSLRAAVDLVANYVKKEFLVILQSSVYPGATVEEFLPALEKKNLKVGKDFFLSFVPEIFDIGNEKFSFFDLPKIVGGVTKNCFEVTKELYKTVSSSVFYCSSPQIAESAKLLQNIYRFVNISLINEMKILFDKMGIDVWEVIAAASTKPFGFTPFYPGPGAGGDCIPTIPFYLTWKAKETNGPTSLIDQAGKVNDFIPCYVVQKVIEGLNSKKKSVKGAKILLLGVGFKKDINDIRNSPALKILTLLQTMEGNISYHDPFIKTLRGMKSISFQEKKLKEFDCVVICTDHSSYDWKAIVKNSRLIVDTRNVIPKNSKTIKA